MKNWRSVYVGLSHRNCRKEMLRRNIRFPEVLSRTNLRRNTKMLVEHQFSALKKRIWYLVEFNSYAAMDFLQSLIMSVITQKDILIWKTGQWLNFETIFQVLSTCSTSWMDTKIIPKGWHQTLNVQAQHLMKNPERISWETGWRIKRGSCM